MEILKPGANCWKIGRVNTTGVLVDGKDYFKAVHRALGQAKQTILMAGWEFNSNVRLLRGADADEACGDVRLLPYLNSLCEKNPDLHVYILAWDFLEFLAFYREKNQVRLFNKAAHKQISFLFDSRHAIGASHHHKMVVIDVNAAFVGGFDLCQKRWDDRKHSMYDNKREPFHDVQSFHAGPVARDFARLFGRAWRRAGGKRIKFSHGPSSPVEFDATAAFAAHRVAISRTQSRTLFPPQGPITEIRNLYRDAIQSARRLIYIENQYFTSRAVFRSLIARMRDKDQPSLQIVLVLPETMKSLIEDLALGFAQRRMLRILKKVGRQYGHDVGIYYSITRGLDGREISKIIHSKLLLVDDRLLSVGSANTANRSMGLDTELNVAWEADGPGPLATSFINLRLDLLREHTGISREWAQETLSDPSRLVDNLNNLVNKPELLLRRHQMKTRFKVLPRFLRHNGAMDPEKPYIEDRVYKITRLLKKWTALRLTTGNK